MCVNFGENLQGKSKDFTDFLCNLKAQNVVKFTEILYGVYIYRHRNLQVRYIHFTEI